jgi:hypothetical protein
MSLLIHDPLIPIARSNIGPMQQILAAIEEITPPTNSVDGSVLLLIALTESNICLGQ